MGKRDSDSCGLIDYLGTCRNGTGDEAGYSRKMLVAKLRIFKEWLKVVKGWKVKASRS